MCLRSFALQLLTSGSDPVYQLGSDNYQMLSFFDANYDRFPIFVFENLNEDDPTWQHKSAHTCFRHGCSCKEVLGGAHSLRVASMRPI